MSVRDVLGDLLTETAEQYAVRGAFLTGSHARRAPWKTSDVDVFVMVEGSWRKKEIRRTGGWEFELFFNPAWKLDEELDEAVSEGNSSTVSILRDAEILRDTDGEIARLKARALEIWRAGPPAWTPFQRELARYGVSDLVKDVDDVCAAGRQDSFRMLLGMALGKIAEAYFGLRRQWLPKPKYFLEELGSSDATCRELAAAAATGDMDALYQLADISLEPAGGFIRGDWALPPERLTQ